MTQPLFFQWKVPKKIKYIIMRIISPIKFIRIKHINLIVYNNRLIYLIFHIFYSILLIIFFHWKLPGGILLTMNGYL